MTEQWEANFLEILEELLRQIASDTQLDLGDENDDQPRLRCIFPVLRDGQVDLPMEITVEHLKAGSSQLQLYCMIFDSIPQAAIPEIEKIIMRLNEFITLGSFGIYYRSRQIFFNHAYAIETETNAEGVMQNIGITLDIIMKTVDNAYDLLQKAVNMEITCTEAVEKNLVLVQ
ncbi:MAG TPA: hypothetical protein VN370_09695 [Desulfitobacteriaceae bacterium]|jgi:hypothetical protein|nr:hypothetical protein [Desulfitobacteriaceae bacterium]